MADRWFDEYIEIELQKYEKTLYQRLMKPTQEGDLESCVEDGFNVF